MPIPGPWRLPTGSAAHRRVLDRSPLRGLREARLVVGARLFEKGRVAGHLRHHSGGVHCQGRKAGDRRRSFPADGTEDQP